MKRTVIKLALGFAYFIGAGTMAAVPHATLQTGIDQLFSAWNANTPGCVVGVAQAGQQPLIRAYGMANLEFAVPNSADTVLEAGSVSKQFTAAAIALLAQDGKLSLDDNVRKYLPELPDYGRPVTLRHMLNHTSGMRDWGGVATLNGWGRGSRIFTQEQVLEIAARQRHLNFDPGTAISYSNTGYNLAAIVVERVSGKSFQAFTQERLFEPLGMSKTRWRDDHGAVVRNRATAYAKAGDSYRAHMPFENAVGGGGLLTTIADLLTWNAHLDRPSPAFQNMVAVIQQPGRFNDGRATRYGMGLFNQTIQGVPMVYHNGVTAGYRSVLNRYPTQKLSVAVLCNAPDANPVSLGAKIADLLVPAVPRAAGVTLDPAELARRVGQYRNGSGRLLRVENKNGAMTMMGTNFQATGVSTAEDMSGRSARFDADGSVFITDDMGNTQAYRKRLVAPAQAIPADLAGTYVSEEANAAWTIQVKAGKVFVNVRSDLVLPLEWVYEDAWEANGTILFLKRDKAGSITGLSASSARVWDLAFVKR
ncbi:MAG: serine hydrolase domain-containing protein [Pseudomonadota bacterium]